MPRDFEAAQLSSDRMMLKNGCPLAALRSVPLSLCEIFSSSVDGSRPKCVPPMCDDHVVTDETMRVREEKALPKLPAMRKGSVGAFLLSQTHRLPELIYRHFWMQLRWDAPKRCVVGAHPYYWLGKELGDAWIRWCVAQDVTDALTVSARLLERHVRRFYINSRIRAMSTGSDSE